MVFLDKRLLAAASLVRHGSAAVDVGTDHAYLPIYLYESGITQKIIACDINEKPLSQAKHTIAENNLTGKIDIKLSDGLKKIKKNQAEDIVICGMGGELIMEIIKSAPFDIDNTHRLILQPMTHIELFRRELYLNGYEIISETPVAIPPHYYTVIAAKFCGKRQNITPLFALIGKITDSDNPDKIEFLAHILKKEKAIAQGLAKSQTQKGNAKIHLILIEELERILCKM